MSTEITMSDSAVQHAPGRDSQGIPVEVDVVVAEHEDLDSPEAMKELSKIEDWYIESREAHSENRAEMALDHDYYDNRQWSEEDKQALIARGQAPLVFNKLAMTVDWVTGTERRTRIDYGVHPRAEDDIEEAKTKERLLKYIADTNRAGWARSRAFKDAVIGGVGWTEQSIRGDSAQEMLLYGYVPWAEILWDHHDRSMDLDSCRYLHRRRWLDLDFAEQMYPDRVDLLRRAARSHMFGDDVWGAEDVDLPQPYRRYDSTGAQVVERRWPGGLPIHGSTFRQRVPATETWYRRPRRIKKIWGMDMPGVEYDETDADMREAVDKGYASLSDAITSEMRLMVWVPGGVLCTCESPFTHESFPYTPVWAKRADRDGMPYGTVRGIRDSQDDYNKRRSKALFLLSTNQLLYEEGAIDPDRMGEVERNLAKPNGRIPFTNGALSQSRVKIERNLELADSQVALMEQDAAHIHDGSGVNRENLGRDTNATSGRAIIAKQQEGSVTTAELFDNLRLEVQLSGEKELANAEQFMTLPMQFRVSGDASASKQQEWTRVNDVQWDEESASWMMKNDITRNQADFVVDQIDFRESVRQAQAEQFWDMLGKMPGEVQIALLDIAVELTDLQNRDDLVKRIRQINGQVDPDATDDPQAMAAAQQKEAEQQQQVQMQLRERLAKVGLDEAKTQEILAKAKKTGLDGKEKALDIARLIEILLPLAPAADRLYSDTKPEDQPNGTENSPT